MKQHIGVLGLGDLGSQLAIQMAKAGFEVNAFDKEKEIVLNDTRVHIVSAASDVLATCSIIHWAIPSESLAEISNIPQDTTVILHDSVMNSSKEAIDSRNDNSNFAITHCLMNDANRVFVASDAPRSREAAQHLKAIGLMPKLISVKNHDILMARSQGVLATLIAMNLKKDLDEAFLNGDLTPSAEELHRVLQHRELMWTQSTLESILANPELKNISTIASKTSQPRRDFAVSQDEYFLKHRL